MAKRQRVASYALIIVKEHILLTQHERGPNKGRWGLPGGGIEYGEDPIASLKREIFEEAGVSPTNYILDDVISVVISVALDDPVPEEFHNIGLVYRASLPDLVPVKSDADGFSSLGSKWFHFNELTTENVSRPIQDYLRKKKILKT